MGTTTIMRPGVGTGTADKRGRIKEVVAPFEAAAPTTDPIVGTVPAAVVPPRGKSQLPPWTLKMLFQRDRLRF